MKSLDLLLHVRDLSGGSNLRSDPLTERKSSQYVGSVSYQCKIYTDQSITVTSYQL